MTITVKLFALLRDRAGVAEASLELPAGATVATAAERLAERFPAIAALLPRVAFAVNREYVPRSTELHDGDEMAVIPAVSGGTDRAGACRPGASAARVSRGRRGVSKVDGPARDAGCARPGPTRPGSVQTGPS
jgi:molybdopterin converting factor subunit 1